MSQLWLLMPHTLQSCPCAINSSGFTFKNRVLGIWLQTQHARDALARKETCGWSEHVGD